MAYSFWKIFLIGQDFITLLIFFPFNILFWRHISFDYKNSNSFLHVFVVNCPFFKITSAKYALYSWKLACFITWTILVDTIVFKISLRESLNFKISVGKEVLNLRKKKASLVYAELQTNISILMMLKNGRKNTKQVEPHYYGPSSKKRRKLLLEKYTKVQKRIQHFTKQLWRNFFMKINLLLKKTIFVKKLH